VYFIEHNDIGAWNKEQVLLWISAHPEFTEFAKNFYTQSIDGKQLLSLRERNIRNFISGERSRITIGKQKDIISEVRNKVDEWQQRKPVAFAQTSTKNLPLYVIFTLFVLTVVLLICSNDQNCQRYLRDLFGGKGAAEGGPPSQPSTSPIDTPTSFIAMGRGSCLAANSKQPKFFMTRRAGDRQQCQDECVNTGSCAGIAFAKGEGGTAAQCRIYVANAVEVPDGFAEFGGEPGIPTQTDPTEAEQIFDCYAYGPQDQRIRDDADVDQKIDEALDEKETTFVPDDETNRAFDAKDMEWTTNEDGKWVGTIPNYVMPNDPSEQDKLREQIKKHIQDKYGVQKDKIEIVNMRNED